MKKILLLSDTDELPGLTNLIRVTRPTAQVRGVSNADALDAATRDAPPDLRLLAFCTDVIVPPRVLNRLAGPAYNVHPGPPQIRGVYPAVFALYHGATRFGATLHEITETVDSGTIAAVDYQDLPAGLDRLKLEMIARDLVTGLLTRMIAPLLDTDGPLPSIGETWSGPAYGKKDFNDLCRLPDDIDEAEYARRYLAVGEGPDHALYFEKFGRRFSLDPPAFTGPIVKGGRQVG